MLAPPTPWPAPEDASPLPAPEAVRSVDQENVYPFTREQLSSFVRDGFLLLWPKVPGGDAFHERMWQGARRLYEAGEYGNNLLSDCPDLDTVLDAPEVVSALTSLLGEDYVLQAHRHCHIAMDKAGNQSFHQDGFEHFRHFMPTDLMVFYYPQEVTAAMGPTAVIPGSQYSRQLPAEPAAEQVLTLGRPGACVIMHFHLWHRATARLAASGERDRYMFKFQFRRSRPFLPVPPPLAMALRGDNPFLEARCEGPATKGSCANRFACAAVWATLSGHRLPLAVEAELSDARSPDYNAELSVASGACPPAKALAVLVPPPGDKGSDVAPVGCGGTPDARCEAAAALQVCDLRNGGALAGLLESMLEPIVGRCHLSALCDSGLGSGCPTLLVHPRDAEWRLEALAALAAAVSAEAVLGLMVPFFGPSQCARTQTRALMCLYDSGVRVDAPSSDAWRAAAEAAQLEAALLDCVARWESWLRYVKGSQQPYELLSGRYTLAEALRCVGRFGTPSAAKEVMQIIGVPEGRDLCSGPGWRKRFSTYMERRRRCPITSKYSPF